MAWRRAPPMSGPMRSAPKLGVCGPHGVTGAASDAAMPYLRDCDPITGAVDPCLEVHRRCATNEPGPANWSIWMSRSSAASPTVAVGAHTVAATHLA